MPHPETYHQRTQSVWVWDRYRVLIQVSISSAEYLWTDAYGPLGQCGAWVYAHLLPQSTSSVTETPPFSASARAAGTIRCSPVRFGINKSTIGLENRSAIKPAGQH
jgi:hypothetical protein